MKQTTHHYSGLSEKEVLESRLKHGENTLTPPPKRSLWSQFLDKLKDPIIIILLVALGLSIAVALYQYFAGLHGADVFFEPVGIFIAVTMASVVGFLFEVSANKKFEVLNKVNDDTPVKVMRDGVIKEIVKRDVVVGDIVILETGEEVPADGELLEAVSLQINESTLTGEPVITKSTDPSQFKSDATYPTNCAMKGTTVVEGHGIMRVTSVGDSTEYGKVYEGAQIDNSVVTPLDRQLRRLAALISRGSYAVAAIIVIGRIAAYMHEMPVWDWIDFGSYLLNTVMIAVTVVVVSVPEGLPMSVTLSLALSMKRMLSTNNLVRKMHACETMGATTVICTDKTGTLTRNQMSVYSADFGLADGNAEIDDATFEVIKEGFAVNSTAFLETSAEGKTRALGNPTEGALLLWLKDKGVDYLPIREETPVVEQLAFSTDRKYMATVVESRLTESKRVLYVKGAPEIVLSMCDRIRSVGGTRPIEEVRSSIEAKLLGYQNQAMRTLGFAYLPLDNDNSVIKDDKLATSPLIFLGITAISDPIRLEVPEAIADCIGAGIDIKIVTGDTPATAKEIGRQIGLWKESDTDLNHISGPDFAAMPDEELKERIGKIKIISRARPMDKQRLVRLLQECNQVVAVTGDGTNDAPALKAAQVGLSMGDGTSVAKEASDITIMDNSFSSISRAVMWGRSLYKNIQRFILFQLTINVAACIIVAVGSFMGTESPLTVTQMLWVNLIIDTFAALAFASLPPDKSVMNDKPRKTTDYIITASMARGIIMTSLSFVVVLFGLMQYFKGAELTSLADFSLRDFFSCYFDFSNAENGFSAYEMSVFFTIFVMMQVWNMLNAKAFATGSSLFAGLTKGGAFMLTVLVILFGQWLIVTVGGRMFSVVPLSLNDWIIIVAVTSVVLWAGEIARFVVRTYRKLV